MLKIDQKMLRTTDTIKQLSGTLHLIAYDAQGAELWRDTSHNLIVATGYDATVKALAGDEDAYIQKIAVGSNGAVPQETDTSISGDVILDIQRIEYPEPATVRFHFLIDYTDAVDMAIREFGLLTAGGRLFSRKTREAAIIKTALMSIVGAWDINV